jgi:Ca-activated chloride channel homolog
MSSDMSDDKLSQLRTFTTPSVTDAARSRALAAALNAFDAAQQESHRHPQGSQPGSRLKSIFHVLKGNWIMDSRFSLGLGTAAVALLMLPLGYQLYLSTAITPVSFDGRDAVGPVKRAEDVKLAEDEAAVLAAKESPEPVPVTLADAPAEEHELRQEEAAAQGATVTSRPQQMLAQPPAMEADSIAAASPSPSLAGQASASRAVGGIMAPEPQLRAPSDPSGDVFTSFEESPVKVTAETPVSTFSIDVDTASYAYVRRMLGDGYMPDPDAVRIE